MNKRKFKSVLIAMSMATIVVSCNKETTNNESSKESDNLKADRTLISSNLVLWLPFTNGSTADMSGNGNNVVFNNATPTDGYRGRVGEAYAFNGRDQYMTINNSASLNPRNITIAVLMKPTGVYTGPNLTSRILMKGDDDQSDGNYYMGYYSSGTFYGTYGNDQFHGCFVASPNTYNLNVWYKAIYTYDGSVGKLYVNGVLVNSTTKHASFTPTEDLLRIGVIGRTDFPYWFNGILDEVRIYKKALTEEEIGLVNKSLGLSNN